MFEKIYERMIQSDDFGNIRAGTMNRIIRFEFKDTTGWSLIFADKNEIVIARNTEYLDTIKGANLTLRDIAQELEKHKDKENPLKTGGTYSKGYGQSPKFEGREYKKNKYLSITEIAKKIRTELKKRFPEAKFSVRSMSFSGGSSLHITLTSWNRPVFKRPDDIDWSFHYHSYNQTPEELRKNYVSGPYKNQESQLNQYHIEDNIYLTNSAKRLFKAVKDIVETFNMDDSDSMTDYFNTNFYYHLAIGSYDRPFKVIK